MNRLSAKNAFTALAFVSGLMFAAAATAQPSGVLARAAPFPEPGEELYSIVANGRIHVFGGSAASNCV